MLVGFPPSSSHGSQPLPIHVNLAVTTLFVDLNESLEVLGHSLMFIPACGFDQGLAAAHYVVYTARLDVELSEEDIEEQNVWYCLSIILLIQNKIRLTSTSRSPWERY